VKIYLNEITEKQNVIEVSPSDVWAAKAVAGLAETPEAPVRVDGSITLSKVDGVVMAQGALQSDIPLLCSRCGDTFHLESRPRFLALYSRDPVMAGLDKLTGRKGTMRSRVVNPSKTSPEVDDPALDITYLSEEFVDLGEVLLEQLRLQIPFQPLCSANCQGLCYTCGTNLNTGSCPCSQSRGVTDGRPKEKIITQSP
jgi:uncharacterized protein